MHNDESRLSSIAYGGETDTYTYNWQGLRTRAYLAGPAGGGQAYYRYLYNGERVMEELNDSGGVLARYTTENDSYYGSWLHLQRYTGESRLPIYDEIGSARGLIDAGGTVTDTYDMDTFGRQLASTGTTPNPYRYGAAWGYITDPSGMLQLGARYYWPEVGRFVQRDPVRLASSRYAYVRNNPVRRIDPTGLWSLTGGGYVGGVGGEVTVGVNPDGGWFFGAHAGVGRGGGFSVDPCGTSSGWKPCAKPGLAGWLGASASAGGSLGPVGKGYGGQAGLLFGPGGIVSGYSNMSPNTAFSGGTGFAWGGSAGVDVGFVGTPWQF